MPIDVVVRSGHARSHGRVAGGSSPVAPGYEGRSVDAVHPEMESRVRSCRGRRARLRRSPDLRLAGAPRRVPLDRRSPRLAHLLGRVGLVGGR